MSKILMLKKSILMILLSTSILTACQKQEEPTANTTQQTQTQAHHHDDNHHEVHTHTNHDHHHDHEHGHGDTYACDNGETVQIDTHDHEGEVMAHAIIDDIEYELPQDEQDNNRYVSPEGLNNDGMMLTFKDNIAIFSTPDGKTTYLNCQKQVS